MFVWCNIEIYFVQIIFWRNDEMPCLATNTFKSPNKNPELPMGNSSPLRAPHKCHNCRVQQIGKCNEPRRKSTFVLVDIWSFLSFQPTDNTWYAFKGIWKNSHQNLHKLLYHCCMMLYVNIHSIIIKRNFIFKDTDMCLLLLSRICQSFRATRRRWPGKRHSWLG